MPDTDVRTKEYGPCAYCRRVLVIKARGLCATHAADPLVRSLYPTRKRGRRPASPQRPAPVRDEPDPDEPTEAELNATIAEQIRNLPPWWNEPDPDETFP